jgi:hypothetical protein
MEFWASTPSLASAPSEWQLQMLKECGNQAGDCRIGNLQVLALPSPMVPPATTEHITFTAAPGASTGLELTLRGQQLAAYPGVKLLQGSAPEQVCQAAVQVSLQHAAACSH